jgi:ABC-2 type transport system ATP-binding protein
LAGAQVTPREYWLVVAEGVLEATGLVKSFGPVRAVDGVDLSVRAGERLGLLGPNGAGKTTTLLMLLGAITPDAGTIEIGGHRLPRHRSAAMSHVGFAAGYLPLHGRAARAAIDDALERFRITQLIDRPCEQLSSGQRTLVGIVKAVLHRPRLLVLDEPTASLDPDVSYRVRQGLLDEADTAGTALLVTSHNMVEAERLCQRVVFISGGRVVADGAPDEVAERFGHGDLEGVFLELAGTLEDGA